MQMQFEELLGCSIDVVSRRVPPEATHNTEESIPFRAVPRLRDRYKPTVAADGPPLRPHPNSCQGSLER